MKKREAKKKLSGFTLIELMVAISIIGFLSVMLISSLSAARFKARDARRLSDISQTQLALQFYYDAKGNYPASLSLLAPTYFSAVPLDPDGVSVYQYCAAFKGSNYHLGVREAGLDLSDSAALLVDADIENDGCLGGNSFSGADPVYDVRP